MMNHHPAGTAAGAFLSEPPSPEALMSTDAGAAPVRPTLQHFTLDELAPYTAEQAFGPTASRTIPWPCT